MALSLPTIRGNHERQVLTLPRERMGLSDRHAADTMRPDQIAWFESLPVQLQLSPEVLMVHGTPRSDVEYWLETVAPTGFRPATEAEIRERADGVEAEVVLCGHTHIPRVVQIAGGPLVVNPGSVGLPAYDDDRPFPHVAETGSTPATPSSHRSGGWSVP
jgi:predicted phosphodiesterase